MVLKDKVYGPVDINEPVIIDLLKTKVLIRTKGIAQFGLPDKYYYQKGYSRYDHSVGVMLLLKKLGASLEEQIAGLLHDISHTAFSHTVDWVIGTEGSEDFQDKRHIEFLKDKELVNVLNKYGFDPKQALSLEEHKLLDREIPDLCADRIDYSIRQMAKMDSKYIFSNLTVVDNQIVMKNKTSAAFFARKFLNLQSKHWGGFESTSRWFILAKLLKEALKEDVIVFDDFYQDDDFVIKKILKSKNKNLTNYLKVLENKSLKHLPKGNEIQHKKFRFIDPLFLKSKKLYKLSEVDKEFKKMLESKREENKKGVVLPKIFIGTSVS